jgi:hypothetical protein
MTARQIIERRLGRPIGPIATMPRDLRRAMLLLGLALVSSPAIADPAIHVWGAGHSSVQLRPSKAPGAIAEVEFANELVHANQAETFQLSLGGFAITVDMQHGPGAAPDLMTVTPPEGYIAVPPSVLVPEGASRVITIYTSAGVGS